MLLVVAAEMKVSLKDEDDETLGPKSAPVRPWQRQWRNTLRECRSKFRRL